MRLKSVYISQYKNLKDFSLNFDGNSFIDVFVGKNGTGKSNLFEALLEIFRHIVENRFIEFDYKIEYEIDDKEVSIAWQEGVRRINRRVQKNVGKTPFPENILIYYSGHNKNISDLILDYEKRFESRIKGADINESRVFIGVDGAYKELMLVNILLRPPINRARQYICEKLDIRNVGSNLYFNLKRPSFANARLDKLGFNVIDHFEPESHYWGADGITRHFLDKVLTCIKGSFIHSDIYSSKADEYAFFVDVELFQKKFGLNDQSSVAAGDVFRMLDNLKTLGMLKNISIPIELHNREFATVSHFSDGQFQAVYIYSIMELFKDRNCITLLDEPDSFLHPEWQFDFLKQVFDITDQDTKKNHVLMSSHSAATLCHFDEQRISLFKIEDSVVSCNKCSKKDIISELAASFIQYSEDESKLQIDNVIRTSTKPILFVEGPSDVRILNTAYRKLYPGQDIPVLIQDAFDRGFIRILMSRDEMFSEYPQKQFFALFDFDNAYDDWRKLGGTHKIVDIELGLCKKLDGKNAHAFVLPIPDNRLRSQVWNEANPNEKVVPNPHFCIEHIFWGVKGLEQWFKEDPKNGKIKFKGDKHKVRFARDIISPLDSSYFNVFRPMFEFIQNTCNEVKVQPN